MPQLQDSRLEERLFGRGVAGRGGCIIWTGGLSKGGYGKIRAGGRHTTPHVASYELKVGPVPAGMQIDHTCHNRDTSCQGGTTCLHRRCFNPFHLEATTSHDNTLRSANTPTGQNIRRSVCVNGHLLNKENTRITPAGHRKCRACAADDHNARLAAPEQEPVRESCFKGHPLTEDNLVRRGAVNTCRTCRRASQAAYRDRQRTKGGNA
jgi:hypothetical protein